MPETDPAIIGIQSCGCITYANAAPDRLERSDEKTLAAIIREGGQVVRTTVGEARAMPHFLVGECPHDPKGWEPYVEPVFEPSAHCKHVRGRNVWRVDVKTYGWTRGGFSCGEVREWDGAWWATEGWFNYREPGATDGKDPRGPSPEFGPFASKKAAVAFLLPRAVERAKQLKAEIDAAREKAAA